MRMQAEFAAPYGSRTSTSSFEVNDNAFRMKMDMNVEGVQIELEFITIGDTSYVHGSSGDNTLEWMKGPSGEGVESPFSGFVDEDLFSGDAFSGAGALTAIDVLPCRDGRQRFVLQEASDPSTRILIDTASYIPVEIQNVAAVEGEPTEILIDWNVHVSIEAPSDPREGSTQELAMAFLGLMMSGIDLGSAGAS